jgi:hypothetical protein
MNLSKSNIIKTDIPVKANISAKTDVPINIKSDISYNKDSLISKIKTYLSIKINKFNEQYNKTKNKSGRPKSISDDQCIDALLYCLVEGTNWNLASKLATGSFRYRSTIHRRFLFWVDNKIISNSYDELLDEYLKNNPPDKVYIDSTEAQNKAMSTKYTHKSFKLKKEALRLSIIVDENKIPLDYSVNSALSPDSELGYQLLNNTKINIKKELMVYGDKGYQFNKNKLDTLLKRKIKVITPKKRYKKRKNKNKYYKYKKKRIRHSKRMKEGLKKRIIVEHANSVLHRSFKRISTVNEKKLKIYVTLVLLAISIMIINKK